MRFVFGNKTWILPYMFYCGWESMIVKSTCITSDHNHTKVIKAANEI